MFVRILSILAIISLAGCAANPASIQAEDVSSEMYAEFSCETLRELRAEKKAEIEELSKSQKTKRIVDGFSNVLLLPGVASVVSDSSKPLARSKGEMNALVREYDRRCIRREGEQNATSIEEEQQPSNE